MDKQSEHVVNLCTQVHQLHGHIAQLSDEMYSIDDHGELAEAEAFAERLEHDLRILMMQLQAALTQVKGLA